MNVFECPTADWFVSGATTYVSPIGSRAFLSGEQPARLDAVVVRDEDARPRVPLARAGRAPRGGIRVSALGRCPGGQAARRARGRSPAARRGRGSTGGPVAPGRRGHRACGGCRALVVPVGGSLGGWSLTRDGRRRRPDRAHPRRRRWPWPPPARPVAAASGAGPLGETIGGDGHTDRTALALLDASCGPGGHVASPRRCDRFR